MSHLHDLHGMPTLGAFSVSMLLIVSFVIWGTEAAPEHLYEVCGSNSRNETEFAPNSTYQSNINRLLSSLSATNATRNGGGGFRNYTAGEGRNSSDDPAYGLSLCRGDLADDVCQDCVAIAARDIVRNCRRVRSAVIWYDQCMLRYSNNRLFSTMDTGPSVRMWNLGNVTDVTRFVKLLGDTANEVRRRAANDASPPGRFATAMKNFTGLQTLYVLAQCTPDLISADCDRCLSTGIGQLPDYGSQGGRTLMPSCNLRYELYPFYNQTAVDAAEPPPPPIVRRSPPPSVTNPREKKKTSTTTIIAIVVPIAAFVVVLLIGCCFLRRAKKKYHAVEGETVGSEITTLESLQFDFGKIGAATNNFSDENKIGEGGFGVVYKGTLPNGQEIAVKRLSRDAGQGAEEFKNEVLLVAKLQHRNLARLLGFCLEGGEKILVYEFVPNKSLDYFIFDSTKRTQLDWPKRYKIIGGIARGILYLHEDSRLRIIHRDLKASNILLDEDMNPKISDFGMARIFQGDQTQGNTSRIVGTYGYMSPEYAMHGQFSVKSDVFSFGVLVLEIISGKKNNNFYQSDGAQDLLSYAWKLWRDGTPLDLMDPSLRDTYSGNEIRRCIHISLLCVQEDEAERPTMATVVLLLNSYSVTLAMPRQPAFFARSSTGIGFGGLELDQSTSKSLPLSVNEVSISELHPR